MITAIVYLWSARSTFVCQCHLDAEPWFDRATPKLLEILPGNFRNHYGQMPRELGVQCFKWTLANHPTDELIKFSEEAAREDGRRSISMCVASEMVREWMKRSELRAIATGAVDKLIGGEP